jgi:hypothetical protein
MLSFEVASAGVTTLNSHLTRTQSGAIETVRYRTNDDIGRGCWLLQFVAATLAFKVRRLRARQ